MPLPPTPPTRNLRIVVVNTVVNDGDEHDAALAAQIRRGSALRIGLLESGYDIVASLPADLFLPERIAQLQPDMIIIDAESDARDVLEHIVIASRDERRPIVLFTEDDTTSSMDAAMAAGVSAYIVAGLQAERIKPVLNVALARFRQEQKLLAELHETRHKLAERKIIDRAKGILMNSQGLSEDQAYQKLRSMAMNKNLKLSEIAQRILDVEDLLG
ncbi:MAG: ANTAR domain-containing response regulator [Massilia sp.]